MGFLLLFAKGAFAVATVEGNKSKNRAGPNLRRKSEGSQGTPQAQRAQWRGRATLRKWQHPQAERQLRQENINLQEKLDRLEKENRMITDRTQKRQLTTSISHQNDKRAASLREIATKWESNCLSESLLIEENLALKKNLDILKSESQMKTVELSRVVE